mmetsp:Transcript_8333/g.18679  ORF Transcript_8333/g.18679 Transcript_8333/m.18679 type:complete len:254 (+) Transcript_8333:408-1169(+)
MLWLLLGLGEMGVLVRLLLVPGMPMLRSGSNDLEEGEVGVAAATGGGAGHVGAVVGVAFMKPNADPGPGPAIPIGSAAPLDVTVSTLASALLTVIFPNKSLEPLATGTDVVVTGAALTALTSAPIPPKKSFCCCIGAATGIGGAAAGGAATGGSDTALVFNPLNKESDIPPLAGTENAVVLGGATGAAIGAAAMGAGSSKSNKLVGGATGATGAAATAAPVFANPFIPTPTPSPGTPNAANTRFAGPLTLALA